MIVHVAKQIPPKILEDEDRKDAIDREVLSRSLIIAAESVIDPFEQKLRSLFPQAKKLSSTGDLSKFERGDMLLAVAPVKNLGRAQVRSSYTCSSQLSFSCAYRPKRAKPNAKGWRGPTLRSLETPFAA